MLPSYPLLIISYTLQARNHLAQPGQVTSRCLATAASGLEWVYARIIHGASGETCTGDSTKSGKLEPNLLPVL